MPVSSQPPHNLELVIDFVNTADLEELTDELETPAALGAWLAGRGLTNRDGTRLRRAELERAIALREALRAAMHAHNGGAPAQSAIAELEQASRQGQLSVAFQPDGTLRIEPRARGFAGALAKLLVPVAEAAADGTWDRVKACRADGCEWAFYDQSRNRSGRWCEMAVCGNRTKVRTYRNRMSRP